MSVAMTSPQRRRHPEAPRFHQRGEGFRACRSRAVAKCPMLPARSLARLKSAGWDDAIVGVANAGLREHAADWRTRCR